MRLKRYKDMRIFTKILVPVFMGLMLILAFFIFYVLPTVYSQLLHEKKDQLSNVVEMVQTAIKGYSVKANSGEISLEQAKHKALELVKLTRFDDKNYIFVFNNEGFLYHPRPEFMGKPLNSFKDVNGKLFVTEMAALLKNNSDGYVDYFMPKPNVDKSYPKLSYVCNFNDWGWKLGAGIYIDDIDEDMASMRNTLLITFVLIILIILSVITLLVNRTISGPIKKLGGLAEKVANGDMSADIDYTSQDEIGLLSDSFRKVMGSIHEMASEMNNLTLAATEGELGVRGNANELNGAFKDIISGMNNTLDALIMPLNVSAEYMDRISKGDIPSKISENYKGDFNEIKHNLNQLIDSINLLVNDANMLANAADEGKLSIRADETRHTGDFRKIVMGINKTFDNLLLPLKISSNFIENISKGIETSKITEEYQGDYDTIKTGINRTLDVLNDLTSDINFLIGQSIEGNLTVRANSEVYSGSWKNIVSGLNKMLDEVLLPVNEGNRVLKMISGGDLREKITMDLKGDHKAMKDAVNGVHEWFTGLIDYVTKIANGDMGASIEKASENDQIHVWLILMRDSIKKLASDVNTLATKAVEGNLSARINSEGHKGEYKIITQGLNDILDTVIAPISEAADVLQVMAKGDLRVSMAGDFKGDHAILKNSMNQTIGAINNLLLHVSSTVEEVSRGAVQVSDASSALSQGATEQAASLEEITSSMAEISSQTRVNAQNATIANSLTNEARVAADKGNIEMEQLNSAMDEISGSSKNISRIIKVIDEIAFQTNLLALNAAVEAARAGRHGKGFAVVAEEVRNLAARSATAAKETSELIEDSIKRVENGRLLTEKTTGALREIRDQAVKAADIVSEIATASNDQAQGISQINIGLSQIDRVTQTNTASAEQSASASEELSGQARELKNMLGGFKLNMNGGAYSSNHAGGDYDDFDDADFNERYHNDSGRRIELNGSRRLNN